MWVEGVARVFPRVRPAGYPTNRSTPLVLRKRPPPSIPRLPNEILIHIVGVLSSRPITDTFAILTALARCCLAAKVLLAPARAALFECVSFFIDTSRLCDEQQAGRLS